MKTSLNKSGNSRSRSRRGTTAVEFSLVFPIIILFFVAMTVFTQAFTMRDSAQHAAYEGARAGLKLGASVEDSKEKALGFLTAMRFRGASVNVVPSTISLETKEISVTVSIPFQKNAWIGGGFMPKDWVAQQTITIQRYFPEED